jgi:hypothetical protein
VPALFVARSRTIYPGGTPLTDRDVVGPSTNVPARALPTSARADRRVAGGDARRGHAAKRREGVGDEERASDAPDELDQHQLQFGNRIVKDAQ